MLSSLGYPFWKNIVQILAFWHLFKMCGKQEKSLTGFLLKPARLFYTKRLCTPQQAGWLPYRQDFLPYQ